MCTRNDGNEFTEKIKNILSKVDGGLCGQTNEERWVVCAKLATNSSKAWCMDSTGLKKEIPVGCCSNNINPPLRSCSDNFNNCQ